MVSQLTRMFTHLLTKKLNSSNFMQWHQFAMATTIKGNRVFNFISDLIMIPTEFVDDTTKEESF